IVIGKVLTSSSPFPPLHTVRETFTSYGAPSNSIDQLLY
ncbi:glutamine ABC transporter permease, partial [Bacillus thuringiensis]